MSRIINGKEIANNLRARLKEEIIQLKNKYGRSPGLAVVQVGSVLASSVYVSPPRWGVRGGPAPPHISAIQKLPPQGFL